jgi:hypothetical protein
MDEDVTIKDWEGPPPAIWIFNLQTETASRITPSKMLATSPCWLSNDEILFDAPSGLNSNKGTKCNMGFGVIPFIDWVFGLRSTPKIAPRLVHQFWEPNSHAVP